MGAIMKIAVGRENKGGNCRQIAYGVSSTMSARLTRSESRIIGGVCGGIAEYLGWSPFKVRLIYVLVSIASVAFPGVIAYLVLWFVMPPKDRDDSAPMYHRP